MDKPMPNIAFNGMSLLFRVRDIFMSPESVLKEVDIKPGFSILDYGCGPGSYSIAAAEIVGPSGKVYALDIHPQSAEKIRNVASKKGLKNIETICSNCSTGLPEESVDVVILYDIFHMLSDPDEVLKELHRVLKADGILSFSDHHMKEDKIISEVTNKGLFALSVKGKKTCSFSKAQ
jgi:ubiquinone/menaquinone biosynthesis C-methylase UbiE